MPALILSRLGSGLLVFLNEFARFFSFPIDPRDFPLGDPARRSFLQQLLDLIGYQPGIVDDHRQAVRIIGQVEPRSELLDPCRDRYSLIGCERPAYLCHLPEDVHRGVVVLVNPGNKPRFQRFLEEMRT